MQFKSSAWLIYNTAFRYMSASKISTPWSRLNLQLYSDILKEETLPYRIPCHFHGHHTLAGTVRSKPSQSFRSSTAYSSLPFLNHHHFQPAISSSLPTCQLQPDTICCDFDQRACRRPNFQFQHDCNKPDCGGNHAGSQCPKGL